MMQVLLKRSVSFNENTIAQYVHEEMYQQYQDNSYTRIPIYIALIGLSVTMKEIYLNDMYVLIKSSNNALTVLTQG